MINKNVYRIKPRLGIVETVSYSSTLSINKIIFNLFALSTLNYPA